MARIAIVQQVPPMLDRDATLAGGAVMLVAEAVRDGARLSVFPADFVAGYPEWVDAPAGRLGALNC